MDEEDEPKPRRGRPQRPIDWEEVEFAMMASETQEEIAASQGLDRGTFLKRFREEYDVDYTTYAALRYKRCNNLLKAAQLKKALDSNYKGDRAMLMFLGKVRLGQRETDLLETTPPNKPDYSNLHDEMDKGGRLTLAEMRIKELEDKYEPKQDQSETGSIVSPGDPSL